MAPGAVYLDHAAYAPSPRVAVEASRSAMERLSRFPHLAYTAMLEEMEDARVWLAKLLDCEARNVTFAENATSAVRLAAARLTADGRRYSAIVSNEEHPGGLAPWIELSRRGDIDVRTMAYDSFESGALGEAGEIRFVSLVSFMTGRLIPETTLSSLAGDRRLVLDGSQAAGTTDISLRRIRFDAFCAPGQKGLLAPLACGFCVFGESSVLPQGESIYDAASGTRCAPALIGLGRSARFLHEVGMKTIVSRIAELSGLLREELSAIPRLEVLSPGGSPLTVLTHPNLGDPAALASKLAKRGVYVKALPQDRIAGLRVSLHVHVQRSDVLRLVDELRSELT